jgi:LexA-binding, inner membrane-associated putative hydrolase
MSWAAHDLEPYAVQRHVGIKLAFVPLLIGSYAPDLMTKWFVYGVHIFGHRLKADNPVQFHRGWPGMGFTHSLLWGVVIGLIIWKVFDSKLWAISFLVGQWAHAITDTGDTVGTMLLFPWTHHFSLGAWAYAGQTGRLTDAAAYFSGLGSMWDLVFVVYGIYSWRVLTGAYFDRYIFAADQRFWTWLQRFIGRDGLIALYRAAFFYGSCRWVAWTLWAHVVHHYPYDLSWGGPHWIQAATP